MAFCRTVFLVVSAVCLVQCVSSSGRVPVFIWGDLDQAHLKSNPLAKVSAADFDNVLRQELASDPFTVVFIEENLSVEDFSRRGSDGQTFFPYLHENIGKAVYLPSVESALHVLNFVASPKADHVKLTENGLSAEIEPESGKFLFINLKDAKEGESRADLLRRHNDFMQEMVAKLQAKYDQVIAVYTAHYPSWTVVNHSRVRRQAEASNGEYTLDGLLLYVNSLVLSDGNKTVPLANVTTSSTSFNNTDMKAVLNFGDESLTLIFNRAAGYWYFNKIELTEGTTVNEELSAVNEVYAIEGFSYRCAESVSFASVNASRQYTVTFGNLKVQPFFESSNGSTLVFGDSFNCVGFFSVPIWSGLFVVFILLAITFFGIMMMMDIRTMDRFDDPKGKTITINASE